MNISCASASIAGCQRVVKHIRSNGYEGRFYEREIGYYEEAVLAYWTIGAPVEQTVIINRCRKRMAGSAVGEQLCSRP